VTTVPPKIEYLDFARERRFGDLAPWRRGELGAAIGSPEWHKNADARGQGCARFAWAIPDEKALSILLDLGPLLELGAGLGYWTFLLRERGGDVVAYDEHPPRDDRHQNGYCKTTRNRAEPIIGRCWTEVRTGRVRIPLLRHRSRTLFICWPPFRGSFAYDALRLYEGARFAYVGEGDGGCTGDSRFHRLLGKEWTVETRHEIPTWDCVHDWLRIYARNP
jgi:hypothetical protein